MKARWKLLGLAGAAGVAATGAIAARNRRPQSDYTPDELRDRLRERLEAGPGRRRGRRAGRAAQGLSDDDSPAGSTSRGRDRE